MQLCCLLPVSSKEEPSQHSPASSWQQPTLSSLVLHWDKDTQQLCWPWGISTEQDGCTVPWELCPIPQHLPWALHRFGCSAPAKKWCCSLLQLLAKTQPSPSRHCLPLESQTLCAEPPTGAQLLHAHQPKTSSPAELPPLLHQHQTHEGMNSPRLSDRIAAAPELPGLGALRLYLLCSGRGGTHSLGAVKSWDTLPGHRWK